MKKNIFTYQNSEKPVPDFLIINRHATGGLIQLPNGKYMKFDFSKVINHENCK